MTTESSLSAVSAFARREMFRGLRLGGVNALARRVCRSRLLIVCYHGVSDGARAGRHGLLVPRAEFERQVAFLASTYRVVPIDAAMNALANDVVDEPTACITFDDGYRNTAELAYPILKSFGVPATVFLATGFVGTARRLWTTDLELRFEQAPQATVDLTAVGLGVQSLDSPARRNAIALEVNRRLKRLTIAERSALLSGIRTQLECLVSDCERDFDFMHWDEVRALAATGDVSIGAHTVNHEILGRIEPAIRAREIADSVAHVDEELSRSSPRAISRVFAYPNGDVGDFTDECIPELRASGVQWAITTQEGLATREDAAYALPRVVVSGRMTLPEFCARASGAPTLWRRAI